MERRKDFVSRSQTWAFWIVLFLLSVSVITNEDERIDNSMKVDDLLKRVSFVEKRLENYEIYLNWYVSHKHYYNREPMPYKHYKNNKYLGYLYKNFNLTK